jgi:tetratricopeptide (TPR) repeat protein
MLSFTAPIERSATASPSAPPIAAGTLIDGRYRVREVLGQGGMGVVYRVDDLLRPERPLALKTIRHDLSTVEHASRLRSEFRLMAGLRHPNVLRVHDFVARQDRRGAYFTMDHAGGGDLWAATAGATLERIVELTVEVCRALAYLHGHGLVHLDIKPSNVLCDEAGRAMVADFGLARGELRGVAAGTRTFIAPEVLRGEAIDGRADLYSLGVTLAGIVLRRRGGAPVELSELPPGLREVVTRLCAADPAERFASARAVIEALDLAMGTRHALEANEARAGLLASRLVGREREREAVVTFVSERMSAAPVEPVLAVTGESGIGKSRLARELRHHCQVAGHLFVEGKCYDGAFLELEPIAEALAQIIRALRTAGHEDLVHENRRELAWLLPSLVPPAGGDAAVAERAPLLDLLAELLVDAAGRVPLVLYLDDLQWARPAVIEVLARAAEAVARRPAPLAIVLSCRDGELADRPASELFERLAGRLRSVRLAPLDARQVETLAASMLGAERAPPELLARVMAETAGVPYLVEELVRSATWGEPRRLARLDALPLRVLAMLAAFARPMPVRVLSRALGVADDALYPALIELERRQLVASVAAQDLTYALVHDRVREELERGSGEDDRARRHAALAAALEAEDGDAVAIAHHWWQARAENRDRALASALVAGERASRAYAHHLAIELFEHALELLPAGAPARRSVEEKLADALAMIGEPRRAAPMHERLLAAHGAAPDRARLLRKLGYLRFQGGDHAGAIAALWRAVELLGGGRLPGGRLGLGFAATGALLVHLGHRAAPWLVRQTRELAEDARRRELAEIYSRLAIFHGFSNPLASLLCSVRSANVAERASTAHAERSFAHAALSYLYGGVLGFVDSGVAYAQRAVEDARRAGSPWHLALASAYLGIARYHQGRWPEAETLLTAAVRDLRRHGDTFQLGIAWVHLVLCHNAEGDMARVRAEADVGADLMARTGNLQMQKQLETYRDLATAFAGDLDGAAAALSARLPTLAEEDAMVAVATHMCLAEAFGIHGDHERALSAYQAAVAVIEERRLGHDAARWAYSLRALAAFEHAAAGTGDDRRARLAVARRFARQATRSSSRQPERRIANLLVLALDAWHAGDRRRAAATFARCLAVAEEMGARLWLARIHLARWELEGRADDLSRAEELIHACGAQAALRRIADRRVD